MRIEMEIWVLRSLFTLKLLNSFLGVVAVSLCSLVKLLLARSIACGHNKVAESNSKNEKA